MRVDLYTTIGRSDRAIDACCEYLARIGIDWSAHPSDDEVDREYAELWRTLKDRPIEALIDLPRATDPVGCCTLDVLTATQPAAYFTDENLHCLVVACGVNLSIRYGNSDASCLSYVGLSVVLGPRFGNYRAAFQFGKLGFDLTERRGLLRFEARLYFTFATLVNAWTRHIRTSVALLRRAFEATQETGDLLFGVNCCNHLVTFLLMQGDPLENVQREAEKGLEFVRKAKFGFVDILVIERQLIRMLRGLLPDFGCLNDDHFDEQEVEQRFVDNPQLSNPAYIYWLRKLQARYLAGSYADALDAATHAQRYSSTAMSHPANAEYRLYRALALAAQHDLASPDERRALRDPLRADQEHLETWEKSCPDNFANRAALVAAEVARIDGDADEAGRQYERAIRSARDHGFVQNEAIAYETAARFYRARGFTLFADTYLREARDRYLRWGADGKVRQIERLHPRLVERKVVEPAATVALRPEQLDLISVVKASQTISGVIVRDELLRTLLQVLLEQGGAGRALVILARERELTLIAEATTDDPVMRVEPTAVTAARAPLSILSYVQRTHERVLLDDVLADTGRFTDDDYLVRACPRSVVCLPVRRQAEVVALLYLENDVAPGAFTPERLVALDLVAAQAAISLENALFLERERAGRVQAEAAGRRALLLGEATALISSTFDYEGAFGQLARLCVRWLADWAIIELMEGERSVRLAGAHRNREKEPLLRELSERYPTRVGSRTPAATVVRTGAPLHLLDISDAERRSSAVDDRHAAIIAQLGTRSAIVVPLIARDIRLGALTLGAASPRHFVEADVELVAEIGRRVALAIDNARLLRETQRAVRLRDEFLAVASHELRTPITSLKFAVDFLMHASASGEDVPRVQVERSLDRVSRKAERLRQLADELLDVTQIEQGRLELKASEVDLGHLVREAVDNIELDLATAGCRLSIDCAAPVVGMWDASRLQQVVAILLSNAVKFGRGRPIEIAVRAVDSAASLQVRDQGIGIDPARLPYVFDRFERAVSSTHYGGLGLGLYIARWIVQAHGGTIGVVTTPGEGSTFTVEIPFVAPMSAEGRKLFA